MITEMQRRSVIEIGFTMIGQEARKDCKCQDFVRDIYRKAGMSLDFKMYPEISLEQIWTQASIGLPLFLHRKATKSPKKITHMGVIFPEYRLLHCSRWMEAGPSYKILPSSFFEVFEVYDFVEPLMCEM